MTTAVVITASADRVDHLDRTLGSLARQHRRPDQVVVVRLGRRKLEVAHNDLHVDVVSSDALDDGLQLGAARNLGVSATSASTVVFLDVDCIAAPDLVDRYRTVIADFPGMLACGPVRYLVEGWRHLATDNLDHDEHLIRSSQAHPARPSIADETAVDVNAHHELFWSLSFGVARETWTLLGGFDEQYVGYGAEDTDFALRARAQGVDLAWFGGGTAYHQWHPPTRLDVARTAEIVANAKRFRERWGTWPMIGWLRELHDMGRIDFDETTDQLRAIPS